MKQYLIISVLFIFAGCASVGKNFEFKGSESISIGKTKLEEIKQMYGEPFRVGYNSGNLQWTYLIYKYSVFSDAKIKDLIITFDKRNNVTDYTYSSSMEGSLEK